MQATRLIRGRSLALAAVTAVLAVPASAGAAEQADLRVEAGKQLSAASYVTDTARIKTTKSSTCKGSGETKTVQGANALGLLWSASAQTKALRPVAVSDEFDFGLLVCSVSKFTSSDTAYWLYKVDHKLPEVGAEQFALKGGEQVLWYYSDATANLNTGDELVLQAPARAKPDGDVKVRVWAYDSAGKRSAAAGATVGGATTDADGRATISAPARGSLKLRAERGADIASETLSVCVTAKGGCPARRGKKLYGSPRADRIKGTKGPDVISVRGGGRDKVRCGSGKDRVRADRKDVVARDCEVVKRG